MIPLSIRTMDGVRGGKSTRWQLVNIDTAAITGYDLYSGHLSRLSHATDRHLQSLDRYLKPRDAP